MHADMCRQVCWRPSGYDLVRLALAVVLLAAAALKGYQLATEPAFGTSLLESRWVLIILVECELLFGLWLVGNFHPRETRWLAVTCFTAFAVVSCYRGLVGAASCGCFGRLHVNPWITLSLDVAAVLSLVHFVPPLRADVDAGRYSLRLSLARRRLVTLLVWVLLGMPAAWGMANPRIDRLGVTGLIETDAEIVVLEPEAWIGKPFPLTAYVNIGEQLREGQWLVMLYHHDCPACRKLFDGRAELAARLQRNGLRLAFVEIGLSEVGVNESDQDAFVWGRLVDTRHWFVETPSAVFVRDGVVASVLTRTELQNTRLVESSVPRQMHPP